MAGKRVNKESPLTAAEKQKRYRQKKEDEETAMKNQAAKQLREKLHAYIDKLPAENIFELCNYICYNGNQTVSMKGLSEMTGISMYELKKLESQGVISPISDYDLDMAALRFHQIF